MERDKTMLSEIEPQSDLQVPNNSTTNEHQEAAYLLALITDRRSVSRRNRTSWFLRQLNKVIKCDPIELIQTDERQSEEQVAAEQREIDKNDRLSSKETEYFKDEKHEKDIFLVSIIGHPRQTPTLRTTAPNTTNNQSPSSCLRDADQRYLVTTNTKVLYMTKSVATSIVLDLSPSIVSVTSLDECVLLDSIFDALKRVLHLLVRHQEFPASSSGQKFNLSPKVFVTVIAYSPFIVAKNNQVLIQNRRISSANIDQVLVEIWICLNRLTRELYELVSNSCGISLDYESAKANGASYVFPQPANGGIIRHPGSVLEDIYELGLFSSSLMPRLSRLSIVIISDGLFSSTNNLSVFRLKSVAVSFVSLCPEAISPDASFGYTSYSDLMRFVSRSTQGVYITHQDLIRSTKTLTRSKTINLIHNPLFKLFCWSLHSDVEFPLPNQSIISSKQKIEEYSSETQPNISPMSKKELSLQLQNIAVHSVPRKDMRPELIAKFFCIDQSMDAFPIISRQGLQSSEAYQNYDPNSIETTMQINPSYHDWRSYKQLERDLDADFEQVLSCLLREGYLIKSISIKQRETSRIVARLVLHWKYNLDIEQELTAPYWNNQSDPFDLTSGNGLMLRAFNKPVYGDTFCEIFIHGSYSFLHNLYCDRKVKRRSEYRDIAYKQFKQLIDVILHTHERLQYLSRFYRDASLSKVPPFLLHGNSLLYEQPHTHKLTSMIESVVDDAKTTEFQEYWQKFSCLDTKSWKNLMHVHTLRLVLEHDQPKHKNINFQNANGRYTHIQCRRAMSAISNFIKSYASFALLEDSTYIRFVYNKDNDLRDIETSATKGFIVIKINKLLPIVVIYLMFTSGILDSHRVKIVNYLEDKLTNCKSRTPRLSTNTQNENILKSKTIYPSGDACCLLVRSPLERMLKVYSRNFVGETLAHNLSLGLPGSLPLTVLNPSETKPSQNGVKHLATNQNGSTPHKTQSSSTRDNYVEDYSGIDSSINRYNLVFGKYLYGVRVVHTISHLPTDLVYLLASNVLAKISAILVNVRIKQGFHIAFNNSGIINLVVELIMQDQSHEQQTRPPSPETEIINEAHCSTCLSQYMIFPPTVTSSALKPSLVFNNSQVMSNPSEKEDNCSKHGSLSGSMAKSDNSFLLKNPSSNLSENQPLDPVNALTGEVKVIREYWIEQQYGISVTSPLNDYHRSLLNMRYSQIVDHLYLTDIKLFNCLLTYDILQLLCDKSSPFYELDVALCKSDQECINEKQSFTDAAIGVPKLLIKSFSDDSSSSSSSSRTNINQIYSNVDFSLGNLNETELPSTIIEGNTRDGTTRVPLIELNYRFSLVKFLDNCQQASLNVALFNDKSQFDTKIKVEPRNNQNNNSSAFQNHIQQQQSSHKRQPNDSQDSFASDQSRLSQVRSFKIARKTSMDVSMMHDRSHHNQDSTQRHQVKMREHRSSYDNLSSFGYPLSSSQSTSFMQQHQQNLVNSNTILCNSSLNHIFLETLHKRLRQMHDKELKLTSTDRRLLGDYLKRRNVSAGSSEDEEESECAPVAESKDIELKTKAERNSESSTKSSSNDQTVISNDRDNSNELAAANESTDDSYINWRCFMRKRNQENMMILFIPSSLADVFRWMHLVSGKPRLSVELTTICPIFVFRCSSTMLNERLLSFLNDNHNHIHQSYASSKLGDCSEKNVDLRLHFGQPCKYLDELWAVNDELGHDILSLNKLGNPVGTNQCDEKTIELVHFRAFLRKIKNTVLKSRFGSLNDAYLSELFIHKEDLLYYIQNVDLDTQKKYHVSNQLKNLADFIRGYEDYLDSLPKKQTKQCNQMLNSILLQKCGLHINQPIARFDEANPLMKQLHDRKLVYLMRCNYKIQLPVAEGTVNESNHFRKAPKLKSAYGQSHSAIDQALRRVDDLGRLEHFCLTPLLFSPSWRSKLAPVRDHTLESYSSAENKNLENIDPSQDNSSDNQSDQLNDDSIDERWHHTVCTNYIKEYEQYIQTLGFNSVQIRYPTSGNNVNYPSSKVTSNASKKASPSTSTTGIADHPNAQRNELKQPDISSNMTPPSAGIHSLNPFLTGSANNTGYLIKFLNSGSLVFKVGFCRPYVYSMLYSIEGERFNSHGDKQEAMPHFRGLAGSKSEHGFSNMTAFLDELDNIKVTMHLHSFTYDYHLRSMYSFISGRQMTFSPGYHLISFVEDFRKYYQKAPNYARNHVLSGEIYMKDLAVDGQQLFDYIVKHNDRYDLELLEMSCDSRHSISSDSIGPTEKHPHIDVGGASPNLNVQRSSNDHVLIELKREKVRYKGGKDSDVFDCGLLITHPRANVSCRRASSTDTESNSTVDRTGSKSNVITLKYFLILTNQRDLYPKLVHSLEDNVSGHHRPIKLGANTSTPGHQINQADKSSTESTLQTVSNTAMCDEEITYLGYFSSDEMDMLRFLKEKTANLREHINQIIRAADVDYRRDYLWERLMQQQQQHHANLSQVPSMNSLTASASGSNLVKIANLRDDVASSNASSPKGSPGEHFPMPISVEELNQLLQIVYAVDLSSLDQQLTTFSTMNMIWYSKLLKAFQELKQCSTNTHRIHQVKTNKTLLLYIDPNCFEAFVLLALDQDKGTVEFSLVLKGKPDVSCKLEVSKEQPLNLQRNREEQPEFDLQCRQLINDFINFCAAFMWSTLLTG